MTDIELSFLELQRTMQKPVMTQTKTQLAVALVKDFLNELEEVSMEKNDKYAEQIKIIRDVLDTIEE